MIADALLYSIGLPLLLAGALSAAAVVPWRQQVDDRRRGFCGALAVAAAYAASHLGWHGRPIPSAMESWEWLLALVAAGGAVAIACAVVDVPGWLRLALFGLLAALAAWLLVPDFQPRPTVWRGVMAGFVLVLAAALAPLAQGGGRLVAFGLALVFAGGAPLLFASANAKFAQFSIAVAVALGVVWLASALRRSSALAAGTIPAVAVLLPGLQLSGYFNDYGDVPLVSFLLLAAAPVGLWVVRIGWLERRHRWLAPGCAVMAVAAVVAIAVGAALPSLTGEPAW